MLVKLSHSIVYHYNDEQCYKQFLQVGRLDCASLSSIFIVLYIYIYIHIEGPTWLLLTFSAMTLSLGSSDS